VNNNDIETASQNVAENSEPFFGGNGEYKKPAAPKKKPNLPLWARIAIYAAIAVALCVGSFFIGKSVGIKAERLAQELAEKAKAEDPGWNKPDYVEYEPIVENEYSRPGITLEEVNGVVVHYVANPGTTAAQNRNYFNNLATTHETWASSHFIIGLDGEALQLIPLTEWAYCSNERNKDTISIECCHPEDDGKFTDKTYDTLVKLLADLCREYDLDPMTQVLRHYDITGKPCPLYFVEHEDEWHELVADVAAALTASEN